MSDIKPHSKLPFTVKSDVCHFGTLSDIADADGVLFAQTFTNGLGIEKDAAYIIHACNNHYALIEALEKIVSCSKDMKPLTEKLIKMQDIATIALIKLNKGH